MARQEALRAHRLRLAVYVLADEYDNDRRPVVEGLFHPRAVAVTLRDYVATLPDESLARLCEIIREASAER